LNLARFFALKEEDEGKWWKEVAELFEDELSSAAGAMDVADDAAAGRLVDVVGDLLADEGTEEGVGLK
jgi:hypothetical protein